MDLVGYGSPRDGPRAGPPLLWEPVFTGRGARLLTADKTGPFGVPEAPERNRLAGRPRGAASAQFAAGPPAFLGTQASRRPVSLVSRRRRREADLLPGVCTAKNEQRESQSQESRRERRRF